MIPRTAFVALFLLACCNEPPPASKGEALRGCISGAAYAPDAQARGILIDACMSRAGFASAPEVPGCPSARHAWADSRCYVAQR